nr:uncharacterized protein LOC109178468 [Ipomoea batatas]
MDEPAMSWPQFKQRCYLRFGPGLRNNSLGNLTRIRQDGRSVEEYSTQFQETLTCTSSVRPDQKVDLFTASIDEWLRIDVENMHPLNLDVAMNLARSLARKQFCFSPAVFPNPPFSSFPFAGGSRQGPTQSAPASRLQQSPTPAASISSSAGSRSVAAPRPAVSRKLMGYDFHVEFRAGRLNTVADALSRRDEEVSSLMALSAPVSPILDSLRRELSTSAAAQALRGKIQSGSEGPQWSLDGDFIRYKGKLFFLPDSPLIQPDGGDSDERQVVGVGSNERWAADCGERRQGGVAAGRRVLRSSFCESAGLREVKM